MLLHYWKIYIT